jgi:two-component system CheB/CheR fusion protein
MQPPKDSPSLRVLVVEDELITAECLALFLRRWGHEAAVARNGSGALHAVPTFKPEVVLLDIGLPSMDGFEVACCLRKLPGMEKCLLMALTGRGHEDDLRRCKEAGIDFHFLKPVEPSLLREVLSSAEKLRKERGKFSVS